MKGTKAKWYWGWRDDRRVDFLEKDRREMSLTWPVTVSAENTDWQEFRQSVWTPKNVEIRNNLSPLGILNLRTKQATCGLDGRIIQTGGRTRPILHIAKTSGSRAPQSVDPSQDAPFHPSTLITRVAHLKTQRLTKQ